jgi:hypothetical protein
MAINTPEITIKENPMFVYAEGLYPNFTFWCKNFWENIDKNNWSSNSVFFYLLFFFLGSIEMILSTALCFDFIFWRSSYDIKRFKVDHNIASLALIIELVYYMITRLFLSITYWKN